MPEDINNNENLNSSKSYQVALAEVDNRNKRSKIRKILSVSFTVLLLLVIIIYFCIGSFHVSHMEISGLVNLTRDDYFALSNYRKHQSLLFFEHKDDNYIIKNSRNLILSNYVKSNMFKAEAKVIENYPVCYIDNEAYLASGDKLSSFLPTVDELSLSNDSILNIKNKLSSATKLPTIHFPDEAKNSQDYTKQATNYLIGAPIAAINNIEAIEYVNDSNNTTWNNVMKVLIKLNNSNDYILFENVLSKYFSNVFRPDMFPNAIIDSCQDSISKNKISKVDFSFKDEEKIYSVYKFKVTYNFDNDNAELIDINIILGGENV